MQNATHISEIPRILSGFWLPCNFAAELEVFGSSAPAYFDPRVAQAELAIENEIRGLHSSIRTEQEILRLQRVQFNAVWPLKKKQDLGKMALNSVSHQGLEHAPFGWKYDWSLQPPLRKVCSLQSQVD